MAKGKKATAKDAQVLIQLYDLRREPEMRKARKFMISQFWPANYDEFKGLLTDFGSERNAWARQWLTYWDMAAAMVLHGAIDENLFSACNTEPFFLFAKYGSFLPRFRKEDIVGDFLVNLEQLANRPNAKARIKELQVRIEARRKAAAAAKATAQAG